MVTFNELKNDKYILDIYKKIDEREKNEWATHGMVHINKVIYNIEYILTNLNCDSNIIECGKIAALLHDIGVINRKEGHALNSYKMAKEYLKDKEMTNENKEIILDAIIDHSKGDNIKSIVGVSLVIADKLDFDKDRLLPVAYDIEYFKEAQYIEKVDININENSFIVNFIVTDKFNRINMSKYYFVEKIFNTVEKFADYINKSWKITINGEEWILEGKN